MGYWRFSLTYRWYSKSLWNNKKLYNSGIRNLTVIVGENLSYDNEKITILEIERL